MGKRTALTISESTMRKNAANIINSNGTMGMSPTKFKQKYGMTPKQALQKTGGSQIQIPQREQKEKEEKDQG